VGNNKDGKTALAVTATGLSIAAIITALSRTAKAAPGELPPLGDEIRQALAAILSQQADTLNAIGIMGGKLDTTNTTLNSILTALGKAPENRILEPFQYRAQTLLRGVPFGIYESKPGKGALIWAIFDVDDPDTDISIRIDDLVWEFNFNTLLAQGVQQPLFPGAWLSQFDAIAGHYCIIFSAGVIDGFKYNQRLIITATFNGVGTAVLHEGRGIVWTYL
jgi:hypothetical protein